MGTKMAAAFAKLYFHNLETEILKQSALKLLVWKRFIDDISLWDTTRQRRDYTIGLTNTIKLSRYR